MGAGKILIVDDEVDALDNCRRILSRLGYDCLTEHDPLHAVQRIRQERPDLVLTDLRMPGLDGIGVLVEAKRVNPRINVVLLTAYATVQTAVASMQHGALDYVLKPYTSKDLEDVAKRAFEQAGQTSHGAPSWAGLDGPAVRPDSGRKTAIELILGRSQAIHDVKGLNCAGGHSYGSQDPISCCRPDIASHRNAPANPHSLPHARITLCVNRPDLHLRSQCGWPVADRPG